MLRAMDERARIAKFRAGQKAAAARKLELARAEGPRPEQAIAEALDARDALAEMDLWPDPRDAVSERAVREVRRRWARIQTHARAAR
jgi:hypothetical protein